MGRIETETLVNRKASYSDIVDENLATIMAIIGRDFGVIVEVTTKAGKVYTTSDNRKPYTGTVPEGKARIKVESDREQDLGEYRKAFQRVAKTDPDEIARNGNPVLALLVANYQRSPHFSTI